jgi:hypothetical protein
MKEVNYDGAQIRDSFQSAHSLRDVISQVTDEFEGKGQVVCGFTINGLPLKEDDEKKFETTPTSEITSMTVKFEAPQILLDESLGECCLYLDQLSAAVEKLAQQFRGSDLDSAHKFHHSCLEGIEWFIQMIVHYRAAYQHLRGPWPAVWEGLEEELTKTLAEILDAFGKKNYIQVADLLEYDLITIFGSWNRELGQLAKLERNGERESRPEPEVPT